MYSDIPLGNKSPQIVNAIVEISKETHNKYEYDEKLDVIKLDRVLHSPMHYPVDYGFIPDTRSKDGDHLDVMIITNSPVFTGCLIEVRPIGVLIMTDEEGDDEKILAVPLKNPNYDGVLSLKDVEPHFLKELVHFFTEYKRLENNKEVTVKGWLGRSEAYTIIKESHKVYQEEEKQKQMELSSFHIQE
jgi:inorganic pyrophosphatase